MPHQRNGIRLRHCAAVDVYRDPSGCGSDNGLGDLLALIQTQAEHFTGRTDWIQTLDAFPNQHFALLGHGSQIYAAIFMEGRCHGCRNTE